MSGPAAVRGAARLALVLLALAVALAAAATAGYLWTQREFTAPGPATALSRVQVEPGVSLRATLARLQAGGVLRSATAVEWYLRLHRLRPRVQAGEYELPPAASPAQILALFAEGKVVLEQLTVVEGASFQDFLDTLAQHPRVQHTLPGKSPAAVMAVLGHPGARPEGQFFPDTYRFAGNTPDVVILGLAYDSMQKALANAWAVRRADLPFDTPYQALVLASMVEKEAALKSERALIAGVFVNRLRRGMRLQSDPTVVYGLGDKYDGTIHTKDLTTDDPYNTYTREGLPPTPIALPGRESLLAAVQPAQTDALFFVATGLNDGAHHFSKTLEEHNSAVQTYLKHLRNPPHAPGPATAPHERLPAGQGGAHP